MVITGLTKAKLGDTFAGLKNVTLATSNGLVYSYGQNLQPKPHYKRTKLHHLATAAAAAANAGTSAGTCLLQNFSGLFFLSYRVFAPSLSCVFIFAVS